MASSSLAAAMGHTWPGTPTDTSPAPLRTAAWAAITGAPESPMLPPRDIDPAEVPLWASRGLRAGGRPGAHRRDGVFPAPGPGPPGMPMSATVSSPQQRAPFRQNARPLAV